MSDERNDGGDAFPQYDYGNRGRGMTLRDWFAGQALAGIIAAHAHPSSNGHPSDHSASKWSYEYADAMLAERSKVKP